MQIATWNVNSIKQRQEHALAWLRESAPDIVCLQEIKCLDEQFPRAAFEDLGYNLAVLGQKSFNGVAILSKLPFDEVRYGLPGDETDMQSRFIEAVVSTRDGALRVCCLYLPNGNPAGTEKLTYKLAWMDRLRAFAAERLQLEEPIILAGDYNVIPAPGDVSDVSNWLTDALYLPDTRMRFNALKNLGYVDALRACRDEPGLYTFWDYQAGAWQKNRGLRIDHLLLSPHAADRLTSARVEKGLRAQDKPSDHVPVVADFAWEAPAKA
jgi:exodeoxyribonuclease-3